VFLIGIASHKLSRLIAKDKATSFARALHEVPEAWWAGRGRGEPLWPWTPVCGRRAARVPVLPRAMGGQWPHVRSRRRTPSPTFCRSPIARPRSSCERGSSGRRAGRRR
jgi:hypothetical protein